MPKTKQNKLKNQEYSLTTKVSDYFSLLFSVIYNAKLSIRTYIQLKHEKARKQLLSESGFTEERRFN